MASILLVKKLIPGGGWTIHLLLFIAALSAFGANNKMAIITGEFASVGAAESAVKELAAAGIPSGAIELMVDRLTVSADTDHAVRAVEIISAHGKATVEDQTDVRYPDDQIKEQRRFVTENRDTSREASSERDDVEIMEEAVERHPHSPH